MEPDMLEVLQGVVRGPADMVHPRRRVDRWPAGLAVSPLPFMWRIRGRSAASHGGLPWAVLRQERSCCHRTRGPLMDAMGSHAV